ncbi:MAG: LuxR C-terminal-related transcriptional regulator [Rhizobiaceae bacterium]
MPASEMNNKSISELIGLVYDSALEKMQWQSLLAKLNELFPGFMGAVFTQEGEKFIGMYTPEGFNNDAQKVYDEHTEDGKVHSISDEQNDHRRELLKRIDPQIGDVYDSKKIFTDEEFKSSVSYKTVLEPAGIGHWISLKFAQSGIREAVFIFFEFEKTEVTPNREGLAEMLELLSPHVVRATRIARALRLAREAAESFQGFLDAIALPMLVTDSEGRLLFSNAAGRRLLNRRVVFETESGDRLRMLNEDDTKSLHQQILEANENLVPGGMRIQDDLGAISLCIAPFHPSMNDAAEADRDLFDTRRMIAIFAGSQGEDPINSGLLRDVFELTEREAEICRAVLIGKIPADIAKATGRAEKTIRNQIQSVYSKVGVNSSQALSDALFVFRTVGAIFNGADKQLFEGQTLPKISN